MNSNPQVRRRALLQMSIAAALLPAGGLLRAQEDFPRGPVKLLVGSSAGGTMDMSARLLAQSMSEALGQQVVVENKTGAAGVIAMQQLVRSKADGYTVAWVGNGLATISPYLYKAPGYDMESLSMIGQASSSAFAIYAAADAPFKDLKGLVAYAKARPGKVFFGSSGTYSSLHLLGEMLNEDAGIEAVHVPFRGSANSTTALMGGEVQYIVDAMSANLPLVAAGKLRAIAVTTPKRQSALPDVQTVAEAGYPGLTSELFYGMVAPPGVPADALAKLSGAMRQALDNPQLREAYRKAGLEPHPRSPQEFRAFVDREGDRVKALIKAKSFVPRD